MKKALYVADMALAMAFFLGSCNKEIENPNENNVIKEGISFEVVATPVETRTENDGMNTKWVADDGINVFHAIAGSTEYVNDGEFTITDVTTNRFHGTIAESLSEGTKYDWYMFYPYTSQILTPANDSKGWVTVGSAASSSQVQSGNGDKSHLAGVNVPLWGKITGVSSTVMPTVSVNQVCAFVEFNVTNNSGSDLTVSEIDFTGTEDIVGTYYVNYAGETVGFTGSGDKYVSDVASLTVEDGDAIADKGTAQFYLAIKPFSATSGTLKVAVNGYEKEINLNKTTTFSAGKIKKINFNYDLDPTSVAEATFVFNTTKGLNELGITVPAAGAGTVLDGNTYTSNNISLSFATNSGSTDVRVWNSSGKYELRTYKNNKLTFTAPEGFNITSIALSGTKLNNFTSSPTGFSSGTWNGEAVDVVLTASDGGNINTIQVNCTKAPVIPTIVNKEVTDISAVGANYTETVSLTNYETTPALSATVDGTVVTNASVSEVTATSATIAYTVSNNVSGAVRSGEITLTDDNSTTGTITIGQKADVFSVSSTEIELGAASGASKEIKVTSDYAWTVDDALIEGFTVTPMSGEGSSSAITLTVTSTASNSTANVVELGAFAIQRAVDNKETETITVLQKSAKLATPTLNISGDASAKTITVSWGKNNNAAKYKYYVLDSEMEYKVEETTTVDNATTSFTINEITLDETYYIAVKAIGDNAPWIDSDEALEEYAVSGGVTTYQHIFTVKPSTGQNVNLSGMKWDIAATNLNGYNSANYAGVQFGTSNKDGEIKLTSSGVWAFEGKTTITEVRLWLNLGGTSVTPTVTIGGQSAVSDGTTVVKNSNAGKDYTKATKVTFTPVANGDTGVVVIDVKSVKAGYICAVEIDCQ